MQRLILIVVCLLGLFFAYTAFGKDFITNHFGEKKLDQISLTVVSPSQIFNTSTTSLDQGLWSGTTTVNSISSTTNKYLDGNNLSNQISQSLYSTFSNLDPNDESNNMSQDEMVNAALNNSSVDIKALQYGQADINMFTARSESDIKAYGNGIVNAQINAWALFQNGATEMTDADSIEFYKKYVQNLLKVKVPYEMADTHLSFVNNLSLAYSTLSAIVNYKDDPAKGILSIKKLNEIEANRTVILNEFVNYFKKNGIIFGDKEPGAVWNAQFE